MRIVLLVLLLAGCAVTGPLANIDVSGRDRSQVDADKLACWQQTEETEGPHSRTRFLALGAAAAIAYAASADAIAARDARIERAAEACMVAKGYSVSR